MASPAETCVLLTAALSLVGSVTALDDVCYTYLGCFPMAAPWYTIARPLPPPQRPEEIDTGFYLHTRSQQAGYLVTKLPRLNFTGSGYNGSKLTVFIVHGFASHTNMSAYQYMKNAVLKEFDANVFLVNWSKGARANYLQVASNTRIVAAEMLRLANYLVSEEGANVSRFHLVGHSLGAHISGYVGKALPGIAKITVLDAAQPGFEGYSTAVRVVSSDALFVEAIHTNARPFIPALGFGYMAPIGHVDFYVNGGFDQPGCILPPAPNISISSLADLGKESAAVVLKWVFCAHIRAGLVYTASLANKKCTFWGHKSEYLKISLSIMSGGQLTQLMNFQPCGEDTCFPLGLETSSNSARGVFLVKTTGHYPYCIREIVSRRLGFKSLFKMKGR